MDRNAPHTKAQPHTTGLYNSSPFLSLADAKQVWAADHHISSCVQTNLSVIQEATTINQNEKTKKILSRNYNYRLLELAALLFTHWRETVCRPCDTKIPN